VGTPLVIVSQSSFDWCLMQSLLLLSSSEEARRAAEAWLAAFDAARAAGAAEERAQLCATEAWRVAMTRDSSAAPEHSTMLTTTSAGPWNRARPPPPLLVG
jgi:hypothetical protein